MGLSQKLGVTFIGGPNNKDCSILASIVDSIPGSIVGSPYFGKLPNRVLTCEV